MTSKYPFGLLVFLLVAGEIPKTSSFIDNISGWASDILNHIKDIWAFLTTELGPRIGDLFQHSKTLVGCAQAAKTCGVDSELDHKDPCGSARKIGWCVFNSCPDVTGSEEESAVIQILNGVFEKIPKCEFRAEALAEEFRHRNNGNRLVSSPTSMVISSALLGLTVIGTFLVQ